MRNISRNVVRTVAIVAILGLSIGLALAMLLARQAVNNRIAAVKASTGTTITVSPAGFQGFQGGGSPLSSSQVSSLRSIPHVVSVIGNLNAELSSSETNLQSAVNPGSLGSRFGGGGQFFAGAGNGVGFTLPIRVTGSTNPAAAVGAANGGRVRIISGTSFAASSNDDVAIVGSSLASKNNLSVGSTFNAYGSTMKVVGVYDAGTAFNNGQLIMPLATLQRLSGQSGQLTSATVTVDSLSNVPAATDAVKARLGSSSVDVTSSLDQAQQALSPLQSVQTVALYSLIGALVAGAVIVLLTMIMVARERRREIGVLKAIGAKSRKVVAQFGVEAVTLTLLGALVGLVLGLVAGNPITSALVNNASTSSSSTPRFAFGPGGGGPRFGGGPPGGSGFPGGGGFRFTGRGIGGFLHNSLSGIHAAAGWGFVLWGLVAAILIALVGSSLASFTIARIRPAEVLRTE